MRTASATYLRAAVFCVLLVICALLVSIANAQPNRPNQARVCFPASSWDARDADRPCVTTYQPQEDGSGRIVQGTAAHSGAVSVCILPNPNEETGWTCPVSVDTLRLGIKPLSLVDL